MSLTSWHIGIQAALLSAGSTGLAFLLTDVGGFASDADPIVIWVVANFGWPLLVVGYGGALGLLGFDVWRKSASRSDDRTKPRWIGIKAAVDYIRSKSSWTTTTLGEAWGADLERDLRREFAKMFGPRTRGREYSTLSSGGREPLSPLKPIPRAFWRDARFDPQEIVRSPARLIARNEAEKRLFDDIEVERIALERAFPLPAPMVHIPMPMTLRECFDSDFPGRYLKRSGSVPVQDGPIQFEIPLLVFEDYYARSMFVAFYVPRVDNYTKAACDFLSDNLLSIVAEVREAEDGLKVEAHLAGDHGPVSQKQLTFSGAVFVYHEAALSHSEMAEVEARFLSGPKARVTFRGQSYATTRSLQERART